LNGTVDAQGKTIAAQKEFIQGLHIVLDATDIPRMQQRFESYKKLVVQEKKALRLDLEKRLSEERDKIDQIGGRTVERLSDYAQSLLSDYVALVAELMPYAPLAERGYEGCYVSTGRPPFGSDN